MDNGFSQFLKSLTNTPYAQTAATILAPEAVAAKQALDTTVQTAQQNHWTPGEFGNNVAKNAGDLAGGLVSLPGTALHMVTHPNDAGPMTTSMIKGFADSVNRTVGEPINTQTGNLQMPSLGKAEQYAYEKPLDAASNLAMGYGAVSKVAKGGKLAEEAAKAGQAGEAVRAAEAAKAAKTGGWMSEGMKKMAMENGTMPSLVQKATKTAAKAGEEAVAGVSDTAANTYLKAFGVRREVAKNINMKGVAKQMINDGITGGIDDINARVRGVLDQTEKMKREALGSHPSPIDVSSANKVISDGLSNVPELAGKPEKAAVYRQQLEAYLPKPETPGGAVNALDVYDSMKNIRNLGYDLLEQGKNVYDQTINAEKANVGKVFIDTAKEINDTLDTTLAQQNIFGGKVGPQAISEIEKHSPSVAQRATQVQGWRDMQALQKPYVDMAKILKETINLGYTPGAKFTNQMTDAMSKIGGAAVGGAAMGGLPGLVGGGLVGAVASPIIQSAVDHMMPKIMTGAAGMMNKGLPSMAIPSVNVGSKLPALSEMALNNPSIPGQNTTPPGMPGQTGQPQQQVAGDSTAAVNATPEFQKYQRDEKGHYNLPTALAQTPIQGMYSDEQYLKDIQAFPPGTPQRANIEAQKKLSDQRVSEYIAKHPVTGEQQEFVTDGANRINNAFNFLNDKTAELDPNIINSVSQISDLKKYTDPKYSQFVAAAAAVKGLAPTLLNYGIVSKEQLNDMMPDVSNSPQQFTAKLDLLQRMVLNKYENLYPLATLVNQGIGGVPTSQYGTTPVQNYNANQGLPTASPTGLPPIQGRGGWTDTGFADPTMQVSQ